MPSEDGRLQNPRQARDLAGSQEVVTHKALDTILAAMAGVSHPRPNHRLQVKRQPLLGASGHIVKMEANGPKKFPRSSTMPCFLLCQYPAQIREFAHRLRVENVACNPIQRLQVPKPTPPFLHIRFNDERTVAVASVP